MNLIESKETYLNELIGINEQHKRALSLAIDCVIDNESEGQDVQTHSTTATVSIRSGFRIKLPYVYEEEILTRQP